MQLKAETYFDNKKVLPSGFIAHHTISLEELKKFKKLWDEAILNGKICWVPIIGVDPAEEDPAEEFIPRIYRLIEVGDE